MKRHPWGYNDYGTPFSWHPKHRLGAESNTSRIAAGDYSLCDFEFLWVEGDHWLVKPNNVW